MRRRCCKGFFFLSFAVLMLLSFSRPGYASAAAMDGSRSSVLTVLLASSGEPAAGGSLKVFEVAKAVEQNGTLSYQYTEEWAECSENPEDLSDPSALAARLSGYAAENGLTGTEKEPDSAGKAEFSGLEAGLYLVTQGAENPGYQAISPFLVTLPAETDDGAGWNYLVEARPKLELSGRTSRRSGGSSGGGHTGPGGGADTQETPAMPDAEGEKPLTPLSVLQGKLPQTGQLNWPVPCLAVGGVLLFAIGWGLIDRRGRVLNKK